MGSDAIPLPLAVIVNAAETPRRYETASVNNGSCYTALCRDGQTRFLKGSDINPKAPANEWVAAQIGVAAGFSVFKPSIVVWKDKKYFGTPYQSRPIFAPAGPSRSRPFATSWNAQSVLYEAMALDAFIANPDRHHGNLMITAQVWGEVIRYTVNLFDHDCGVLSSPGVSPRYMPRLLHFNRDPIDGWVFGQTAWVREDCEWHEHIFDWDKMLEYADRIMAIPPQHVRAIVESVPSDWIDSAERVALLRYLRKRQHKLKSIIDARKGVFPMVGSKSA